MSEKAGKPYYQEVYNAIAKAMHEPGCSDGMFGPIFVRLAWHSSGTYCTQSKNGGSCPATMRFDPEAAYGCNKGLDVARNKLAELKEKFPSISHGDLWTLAGVVAVQEMGGPIVKWRPGRVDGTAAECPPNGRLPAGSNPSPAYERDIFNRMGFNDQEMVALLGGHTVGGCHPANTGYAGPWTHSPNNFTNAFFRDFLLEEWVEKEWDGPAQYTDKSTGLLLRLPADMAFLQDAEFKKWMEVYARDGKKFFEDFAKAFQKLEELGVPFPEDSEAMEFKPVAAE